MQRAWNASYIEVTVHLLQKKSLTGAFSAAGVCRVIHSAKTRMPSPGFSAVVRFGDFEFEVSSRELRKGGIRLKVTDQSLEILTMLLERPGELISRDAIQAHLWPNGTVVEFEHSINSAIRRLRQALLDTANEPRFIETLPRKGYRFIGVLETGPDKRMA